MDFISMLTKTRISTDIDENSQFDPANSVREDALLRHVIVSSFIQLRITKHNSTGEIHFISNFRMSFSLGWAILMNFSNTRKFLLIDQTRYSSHHTTVRKIEKLLEGHRIKATATYLWRREKIRFPISLPCCLLWSTAKKSKQIQ